MPPKPAPKLSKPGNQRKGIRANITKETNQLQNLLRDTAANEKSIHASLQKLLHYHARHTELSDAYLEALTEEGEIDTEISNAAQYDEWLMDQIAVCQSEIRSLEQARQQKAMPAAAGGGAGAGLGLGPQSLTSNSGDIKLPKLEIESYDGDPMKWHEFWDSFSSTIDKNARIRKIDKFKYLKSYLSGPALRLVAGYETSEANYDLVKDALRERFGNKQVAITHHLTALFEMSRADNSVQQLQQVYDDCEMHVRSLVALDQKEETFGLVFTTLILTKLPPEVKLVLERCNGSAEWTLANLRKFLKEEIRAREMAEGQLGGDRGQASEIPTWTKGKGKGGGKSAGGSTASMLPNTPAGGGKGKSQQQRQPPACVFCGETGHGRPDYCRKFTDKESRLGRLRELNRCFKCFGAGHRSEKCNSANSCYHCKRQSHNSALCNGLFDKPNQPVQRPENANKSKGGADKGKVTTGNTVAMHGSSMQSKGGTHMQTALTQIQNVDGKRPTQQARLLFDTAGFRSYITRSACQGLGARVVGQEAVSLGVFGEKGRKNRKYDVVTFDVVCCGGKRYRVRANVTESITSPVQKEPLDFKRYPMLRSINLAEPNLTEPQCLPIDVLIGADHYYDFVEDETVRFSVGLVLVGSVLGYLAAGVSDGAGEQTQHSALLVAGSPIPDENFNLERFWKLEEIGITDPPELAGDQVALDKVLKSIEVRDDRYYVEFPWKSEFPELPDNQLLARGRLRSLMKKLNQNPAVLARYDATIREQMEKGIVEEVPEGHTDNKVYYMPHHAVITPGRTTKIRVVFDASSKAKVGMNSLNECLHRGAVLMEKLCGILLRIRTKNVVVLADVEKAFLQVGVKEHDRDVTRFIWLKDPSKPHSRDNEQHLRFSRVAFGIICSPFLLAAVILYHLRRYESITAKQIERNLYVDNVACAVDTVEEGVKFYDESKAIFTAASMNLRVYHSNSSKVVNAIPEADRGDGSVTKVLGLTWDKLADTLGCRPQIPTADSVRTKRQVVSALGKLYDPCGFYAPLGVAGKLFVQELWVQKVSWDDAFSTDMQAKWEKSHAELLKIPRHSIERQVTGGSSSSVFELHCFADASGLAYAAAAYLVEVDSSGKRTSRLLMSKGRVCPVKKLTIPRLELLAAMIGSRLMKFVREEIDLTFQSQYLWVDSQCVYHWLCRESVSTVFVANRVREIKANEGVHVRYVPSKQNPADLASRGCSYEVLIDSKLWWSGPEFLALEKKDWPESPPVGTRSDPDTGADELEILGTSLVVVDYHNDDSCVIPFHKYSSASKVHRVVGWIKRFISNCRTSKNGGMQTKSELTARELGDARECVVRLVQGLHYGGILSGQPNKAERLLASQLGLFVDNSGLLRCRGRLAYSDLSIEAAVPSLLPKLSPYTTLVILDCHHSLHHAGVSHTLTELRQSHWVPQGRSQIKSILRTCKLCRKIKARPFRVPTKPDLPSFRSQGSEVFKNTGIDYLGPLYVRDGSEAGRKVWICLFTCALVRAIHLEVITEVSAEQFLLALRRFGALYGYPHLIISDNAKQFRAAEVCLRKEFQAVFLDGSVRSFCGGNGVNWKFITEKAPWMGGFYERLVLEVKKALKSSLDKSKVSLVELQTLCYEISSSLNSRPLTYVENDVGCKTLSPSDFLLKCKPRAQTMVNSEIDHSDPDVEQVPDLALKWRRMQSMLNGFWQKWQRAYLTSLREQGGSKLQRDPDLRDPQEGMVVIVRDAGPRGNWKVGRIAKQIQSFDGKCRSVLVRLANRNILRRPIKLLSPLEMSVMPERGEEVPSTTNVPQPARPTRLAAAKARKQAADQLQSDEEPDH